MNFKTGLRLFLRLRLRHLGEGARALARFNVRRGVALNMPGTRAVRVLKRRERRAPRTSELGRAILRFSIMLALSGAINHCAAADASFAQGLAAGRAGELNQATKDFQAALAAQPASGTLLNLGLVHWRSGRIGEAIICWEQSAWLNPFDHDARNNLLFARTETQVEPPELTWYERSSTWLPANFWAGIFEAGNFGSVCLGRHMYRRVPSRPGAPPR